MARRYFCCSTLDFVNILSFWEFLPDVSIYCLGFLQDVCHKTWVFLAARRFRWRLKSLTKHIYQKMWFRQESLRFRLGPIAGASFFFWIVSRWKRSVFQEVKGNGLCWPQNLLGQLSESRKVPSSVLWDPLAVAMLKLPLVSRSSLLFTSSVWHKFQACYSHVMVFQNFSSL